MAETWLDKCESFHRNIVNGNHPDARKLLKSYSRNQRYECIMYIKDCTEISSSRNGEYMKMAITGKFE